MLKSVHNLSTGELFQEEMSAEEISEIERIESERVANEIVEQTKRDAKDSALSKLAALGLTEDEAKAILGL